MKRLDPAWVVVAAGVSAALHVGKLPPALPVLREALGVSLVQAGFLLSTVQVAGMLLGLAAGAFADRLGPRRIMALGLVILFAAGSLGAAATGPASLLLLRACEGAGFLLASLPAPSLIRRLVAPADLSRMLGFWGAYMPFGTALALLAGAAVIAAAGWRAWWLLVAAVSLLAALGLWRAVPASADARQPPGPAAVGGRIRRTLTRPGPWIAGLAFATYSAQWLAVIGFLPVIYAQAGVAPATAAAATALAAAVNMVGNIGSGRLLHAGVRAPWLLAAGFAAMAGGALVAFGSWTGDAAWLRFVGVLVFSAVGGLIPGTLFSLAVRIAPDEGTVSTTVGWMQQWSSFGQFAGPPLVAALAARSGGWESGMWALLGFASLGLAISGAIAHLLANGARVRAGGRA